MPAAPAPSALAASRHTCAVATASAGRPVRPAAEQHHAFGHSPSGDLISGPSTRCQVAAQAAVGEEPISNATTWKIQRKLTRQTTPLSFSVTAARVTELPNQESLLAAVRALKEEVASLSNSSLHHAPSGIMRFEVALPAGFTALQWLMAQTAPMAGTNAAAPVGVYFSPRTAPSPACDTFGGSKSPTCAGWGSAWTWRGEPGQRLDHEVMAVMQRFVVATSDRVKVLGGARFDPDGTMAPEWEPFGSYYMCLPAIDLVEGSALNTLAVNVTWDADCGLGNGAKSLEAAIASVMKLLDSVREPSVANKVARPRLKSYTDIQCKPDRQSWDFLLKECLSSVQRDEALEGSAGSDAEVPEAAIKVVAQVEGSNPELLQEFLNSSGTAADLDGLLSSMADSLPDASAATSDVLTKVVLARRDQISARGNLQALQLLDMLQQGNRSSYQVALLLPNGSAFIASTPERLYMREGRNVTSEAVAGTRARGGPGNVEQDFYLGLELLRGSKEHVEFSIVRNWVQNALSSVCSDVAVTTAKALLKQPTVQHLYGKLTARLMRGKNDADLLDTLHPTPAVCGRPKHKAYELLQQRETFDRGFYAGPFGYLSGASAEFVVGIRSALILPYSMADEPVAESLAMQDAFVYTGVGIVHGSDAASEWKELDLKASQYQRLMRSHLPLQDALPNAVALWAYVIVEELVRSGVTMFAIAPGSRSSPLTHAVFQHPRATHMLCIDERSLGFWAVGHGVATGHPVAVITTSGTAVANLLPAVVEASQSNVPLVLLTSDRPVELRGVGANQAIDQVKIFGDYVRFQQDLAPPDAYVSSSVALTTVDAAVRHATSDTPGPVHLNCQFREPLAPVPDAIPANLWEDLGSWHYSDNQYTAHMLPPSTAAGSGQLHALPLPMDSLMETLRGAQRGVIVAGTLRSAEDRLAVLRLAQALGWPVIADVLSGLRVGAAHGKDVLVVHHLDTLLTDDAVWRTVEPDCVLQIGAQLVSKRVAQFLQAACRRAPGDDAAQIAGRAVPWIFVAPQPQRHDAAHLVSTFVQAAPSAVADAACFALPPDHVQQCAVYRRIIGHLDAAVGSRMRRELVPHGPPSGAKIDEPTVAMLLAEHLPLGHGLFVGSSMPIRDLDMFAQARQPRSSPGSHDNLSFVLGSPIASNRGASGIDGVLSSAAGFASGLRKPATLLIGDVSFVHDTNGLMFLHDQPQCSPLTVVLINNSGGGIFHFLPINEAVPEGNPAADEFASMWATPPNVNLEDLCRSHHVPYQRVTQTSKFVPALHSAWGLNAPSVIEVVTDRHSNVDTHRALQKACNQAAQQALFCISALDNLSPSALPPLPELPDDAAPHFTAARPCARSSLTRRVDAAFEPELIGLRWRDYSLPLDAPVTVGKAIHQRKGLILELTVRMPDGRLVRGCGDVTPLPGLYSESMAEARAQVAVLEQMVGGGVRVPVGVAALDGKLQAWWRESLGVNPDSVAPSVQFAVETALLEAVAVGSGQTLARLLRTCALPRRQKAAEVGPQEPHLVEDAEDVLVNSLMDPALYLSEICAEARRMVMIGCMTIKIKVARRKDPIEDAKVVAAVREACGDLVEIRADANRLWNLDQALLFAKQMEAQGTKLEYLEEPVKDPANVRSLSAVSTRHVQHGVDLETFLQNTTITVALDESLDDGLVAPHIIPRRNAAHSSAPPLSPRALERISVLVIKPSCIGSMERSAELIRWATERNMQCVISSAFDSSVGMSHLAALAAAVDTHYGAVASTKRVAHGLGTLQWFVEDVVEPPLPYQLGNRGGLIHAAIRLQAAAAVSQRVDLDDMPQAEEEDDDDGPGRGESADDGDAAAGALDGTSSETVRLLATQDGVRILNSRIDGAQGAGPLDVRVLHVPAAEGSGRTVSRRLVFLHGFLGAGADWIPVMHGMSQLGYECVALDLPGHGVTRRVSKDPASESEWFKLDGMTEAVVNAIASIGWSGCTVCGYSLGARLALEAADKAPAVIGGVVSVSGSPGLQQKQHQLARLAQDESTAATMASVDMPAFVELWYNAPLWRSLRRHPAFNRVVQERIQLGKQDEMAAVLVGCSPGRQNLWRSLKMGAFECPVSFVVGALDSKFVSLAAGIVGVDKGVARSSAQSRRHGVQLWEAESTSRVAEVGDAGHAVHIEQPLSLVEALSKLL